MELNFLNTLREYTQDDKKMPEEIKKEISELEQYVFSLRKNIHFLVDSYSTVYATKNLEIERMRFLPAPLKLLKKEHLFFFAHIDELADKSDVSSEWADVYNLLMSINNTCSRYKDLDRSIQKEILLQEVMYKHITHYINIFNSLKLFCLKRYGYEAVLNLDSQKIKEISEIRERIKADDEYKEEREEIENELNKRYAFAENYEQIDDFSNKLRIKTYKEIRERDYPRKLFLRRVFMFIFFSVGWVSVTVAAAIFTKNFCNMIMKKDTPVPG